MENSVKILALLMLSISLFSFASADIISINAGGDEEFIIHSGANIEQIFFDDGAVADDEGEGEGGGGAVGDGNFMEEIFEPIKEALLDKEKAPLAIGALLVFICLFTALMLVAIGQTRRRRLYIAFFGDGEDEQTGR